MNLQEIGERFGLTREAVRMVLVQQAVDYPMTVQRRRNLDLASQARAAGARVNTVTRIQNGSRKGKKQPEYGVYTGMLERCDNPNTPQYADYGGRGITVCERWRGEYGYEKFLLDMGLRPSGTYASGWPLYSIHRVDNDGPYSPENCIWATQKEQCAHKRPPVRKTKLTANPEPADAAVNGCVKVDDEEECTAYREDVQAAVPVRGSVVSIVALPAAASHSTRDSVPMLAWVGTAA